MQYVSGGSNAYPGGSRGIKFASPRPMGGVLGDFEIEGERNDILDFFKRRNLIIECEMLGEFSGGFKYNSFPSNL